MRLISVIYDEFLNNFRIQHPVHIAKFSPSPTGPWSLQETGKTLYRYFPVKSLDWDSASIPGSSHRFPRAALSHVGNKALGHWWQLEGRHQISGKGEFGG